MADLFLKRGLVLLSAFLGIWTAACSGHNGGVGYRPDDDADGGDKQDGSARTYQCAKPEWNNADWLANSGCYYVVNVKDQYFNNWCYAVKSCTEGQPPPGKTVDQIVENHDRIAFLTSLQGLVNRDRATLYLIAEDKPDEEWLRLLAQEKIWLTNMQRVDVSTVEDAIELFADHPGVAGSVEWTDSQPFTMNIAYSMAGADNLVLVREGSVIADEITAAFPLKENLIGKFESKRQGYEWLIDNYMATGKLNPEVELRTDAWGIHASKTGPFYSGGFGLMSRDYTVAHKQFSIAYGVNPNAPDPSNPSAPKGEGRAVLQKLFNAVRARLGPNKMFTATGWPPGEYSFDCNNDGMINASDNVSCEEWEWIHFLSANGGMERMGDGAYAKEGANTSFFAHGPGVDLFVQPSPPTPEKLLENGYVVGPPRNYSFESGDASWTLTSTNRSVVNEPKNAFRGGRFLQLNVSPADVGKGFYQDITLPLQKGQHYRFSIRARSVEGKAIQGHQRVAVGATVLCDNAYQLTSNTWTELTCDFQVTASGLANPRLSLSADTANANYAFDDALLLGATSMEVNGFKKFALFYMGDYDFANAAVIVPIGVYPFPWTTPSTTVPVAYSMPSDARESIPPIFAYFAKTAGPLRWFVMPDSGAGYINPGYLPAAFKDDWLALTTKMHRPVNYRTGWVLNGHGTGDVAANNAAGNYIRDMYRILTPDGFFYQSPLSATQRIDAGLPVLPMDSGFSAGVPTEDAATTLAFNITASPYAFNVFRNVFVADSQVEDVVNLAHQKGAAFDTLDPITFMALYRQSKGFGNVRRLVVVKHDVPDAMTAGQSVQVHLTVRNDAWDAWISKPDGREDCDGSGTSGQGCERVAWGFTADPVVPAGLGAPPTFPYTGRATFAKAVYPGDTADVTLTLIAPTTPGTYTFQVDGVKEIYGFFESAGNVPWQKTVTVR